MTLTSRPARVDVPWLSALAVPAMVVDPDGRIAAVNDAYEQLTPVRARGGTQVGVGADYLGTLRAAIERGDMDAAAILDVMGSVRSGRQTQADHVYACPAPSEHRWFRATIILLSEPADHVLITHAPSEPPDPMLSPQLLDQGLLHDLAAPVGVAAGWVETLGDRWDQLSPEQRTQALEATARQLEVARRLIRSVRDTPAPSQLRPEPTSVPLAAKVAEAAELAEVTVDVVGDLQARAMVDGGHLRRILDNLLSNAAKYGTPPYVVSIRTSGSRVQIHVRDHGPGIADSDQQRIFAPRLRLSAAEERGAEGSGLGLAIVRELLRANGGSIRAVAADPGAEFVIDLPADATRASSPAS